MNKVSAVIVTYNRLNKLKKSVCQSLKEDFDNIIIVNNASNDGTEEWLKTLKDKRLHILNLKHNIGGAGGFHIGIKYVIEKLDSEWLVCFDDDAYPYKDTIKKFKDLSFEDNVVSIAAAVFLPNGKISKMNIPRFNLCKKKKHYLDEKFFYKNKYVSIDMSSFVGYFVRTSIIKKLNHLPRKELFIYGDDLIFSLTLTKKGYKHFFVPQLKFIHDTDTIENEKQIYKPIWKVYFTFRNGIELYRIMEKKCTYFYAVTKFFQLFLKRKYYPNKLRNKYDKLLFLALKDGLLRNFDRSFQEILRISNN